VHVNEAARRSAQLLDAESGVVAIPPDRRAQGLTSPRPRTRVTRERQRQLTSGHFVWRRLGVAGDVDAATKRLETVAPQTRFGRFRAFRVLLRRGLCCRPQSGVWSDNTRCRFAGSLAGATGLEPATSGVTGRRSGCSPREQHRALCDWRSGCRLLGKVLEESTRRLGKPLVKPNSCPASAEIAPRRSPVRVRLAPSRKDPANWPFRPWWAWWNSSRLSWMTRF
jgi:hypothetical protein